MSTSRKSFCFALCLTLSAAVTWAGGPIVTFEPTGEPFRWDVSGPVIWNPDQGGLGVLSNAEAVAFTAALFQTWEDIPTASISYAPGAPLADDVDSFPELIAAFNDPTATAIIFDEDGSLFEDLFGPNSGVLGFAGPNFVGLGGGGEPTIVTGVAALNGAWLDGDETNGELSPTAFGAVFFHEFGHMSGLDHSQVNGIKFLLPFDNPGNPIQQIDPEYVETMFPFLVTGAQGTPHRDDIAHISALYPDNGATSIHGPGDTADGASFGAITGHITFADEVTPLQGINVIARNVRDKLGDAVAFVSGSTYSGNRVSIDFNPAVFTPFGPIRFDIGPFPGLGPADNIGFYVLNNLLPRGRYQIEVEEVQIAFTGGSSVGPQSPPIELNPGDGGGFVQLDAWNNAESGSSRTDNPRAQNAVKVFAGKISSGYDVHLNDVYPDPNEPNDDFASATPLTVGVPSAGTMIHPVGDVDVYSFTLAEETAVIVETSYQTPSCCFNEIDTVVGIYQEDGSLSFFGDDDDLTAGFTRFPPTGTEPDGIVLAAGTYFVKVTTFPDLYNELLTFFGFPLLPTDYDETSIGVYSVAVSVVP